MILYHFDAMLHELVCWPDSGEHEDLGGVDGTRGQDDLFASLDAHHAAVHAEVLYARCLQGLGVHQHPGHVSVSPHCPRKSDYMSMATNILNNYMCQSPQIHPTRR